MSDVQQLAETSLGRLERMSVKAELKRAGEVIRPDESAQLLAVGSYKGTGNSLLILTDRRLIVMNEVGSFNKKLQVHDIALERVSHVASESGVHGKLKINASGGDIEVERILPGKRAGEIADAIRDRMSAPAAPSGGGAVDVPAQLRQLAELRDSGILTADEFEAKKAELLARM